MSLKVLLYLISGREAGLYERERRRSRSPAEDSAAIRGFSNESGANNCFLNCAVQALWNLDPFRAAFVYLDRHHCDGKSCIFCALGILAVEYQYHKKGPISPDTLRYALAKTYKSNNKFQIGYMDDAAECFESLLCRLHLSLSQNQSDSSCIAEDCIAHRLFSMTLVEQVHCLCGSTSEPVPFSQYIFYIPVTCIIESFSKDIALSFSTLIHQAAADKRPCSDDECTLGKLNGSVRVSLIERPDVFCIGFAWPSDNPSSEVTHSLLNCLEPEIELDYIFHHVLTTQDNLYKLVGIMTYYGRHYFTFFYHSGVAKWLLYDDAQVIEVGSNWEDVKTIMTRGRYQPLILIYANPNPSNKMSSGKKIARQFMGDVHRCSETPPKLMDYMESPEAERKPAPKSPKPKQKTVKLKVDAPPRYETVSRDSSPVRGNVPSAPEEPHNFLDNMIDEVGQKFHEGLSLFGISENPEEKKEEKQKKKHIEDCFKDADEIYLTAKKHQINREYEQALDHAVRAAQFYKYIMKHEHSSLSQRSHAKIQRETVLIRCRRIYRHIPQVKMKNEHLEALFSQCPNCDRPRPDKMRLCYKCTKMCVACSHILEPYEVDYCAKCVKAACDTAPVTRKVFEKNLQKNGTNIDDVVWFHKSTNSQLAASSALLPPPPYESLPRASTYTSSRIVTHCVLCGKEMGKMKGAICHKCSVNIERK